MNCKQHIRSILLIIPGTMPISATQKCLKKIDKNQTIASFDGWIMIKMI